MTLHANNFSAARELSIEELDEVAGGRFSFGGLLKAVVGGGAAGALRGAVGGGAGAGAGAVGGGLIGGIGYCISELF
jgi:hypothetical protein